MRWKFPLSFFKPCWNFSSIYGNEILAYNRNFIFISSLVIMRNFNPNRKTPCNKIIIIIKEIILFGQNWNLYFHMFKVWILFDFSRKESWSNKINSSKQLLVRLFTQSSGLHSIRFNIINIPLFAFNLKLINHGDT